MLLTDFSFSNQFRGVLEHCGPIIPLSQGLCCQGPGSDMVAINAFMHLPEYVVGVFLSYALEDGCRKASFIKGSLMEGESSQPRSELGRLLRIVGQCSFHQVIQCRVHPAQL